MGGSKTIFSPKEANPTPTLPKGSEPEPACILPLLGEGWSGVAYFRRYDSLLNHPYVLTAFALQI